jgi:hypothetical protein
MGDLNVTFNGGDAPTIAIAGNGSGAVADSLSILKPSNRSRVDRQRTV